MLKIGVVLDEYLYTRYILTYVSDSLGTNNLGRMGEPENPSKAGLLE